MKYMLPRATCKLLEETFGNRKKAENFAHTMEEYLNLIATHTETIVHTKLEPMNTTIKETLRKELITRELFDEKILHLQSDMDDRFKYVNLKLNLLIAIALAGMTATNATLIDLAKKLFA